MNHIHHIVPRYMGGSNHKSNLITLTIEEHAMAHKALYEEHGNREDYVAWKSLLKQMEHSERQMELSSIGGKNNMGKPKSEEHRAKISEALRGKISDMSPEDIAEKNAKISNAMQGNTSSKNHSSDEYKSKQSLAMKEAWARRKAKK